MIAFKSIVGNSKNELHALLPQRNNKAIYSLRKRRTFNIPTAKTKRYANSFIICAVLSFMMRNEYIIKFVYIVKVLIV